MKPGLEQDCIPAKVVLAKPKLHTSKKWLYRKYVIERMTEQQIAAEAGTDQATINRWLHRHELKRKK